MGNKGMGFVFTQLPERLELAGATLLDVEEAPANAPRHERHARQIELERENKVLRQTLAEVEAFCTRDAEQYTELYENAPVGYVTLTESGLITENNLTAATLLGFERHHLLHQRFEHFITVADRDRWLQLFTDQMQRQAGAWTINLTLQHLDRTSFPVQLDCRYVANGGGPSTLRIALTDITNAIDMTARKAVEVALQESEAFKVAILNSLPTEIAVVDRDGVVRAVNEPWRRFARESGIKSAKPACHVEVGASYLAACDKGSSNALCARDGVQAVLDGRLPGFTMEYVCHSTPEQRWFSLGVTPLGEAVRGGAVVTHTEITERKRSEAAMMAAMAQAETADHAKSRFLAAASHDLRQPLSALSLYVGVLKSRVPPNSVELVGNIQDCVDSLSELLTDLLDVSKLDAGVVTPKVSNFSIDELLEKLVSVHSAEAALKGLSLRTRSCGAVARTDQTLLRRMLGNLVANAIRYTNAGGVLIACRRHRSRFWVEVWDTGIGIPENKTGEIFEEFRQLGHDERNRGSGLGLAIVAKAAALLGLRVRVRSRLGRGSMFAVELPLGKARKAAVQRQPAGRPLRIALVEDNAGVLNAMVCALEGMGHTVVAAATGKELLDQLGSAPPELVISDYRLGGGQTGFDVIAAARARFGDKLPALLITGDTDPRLIRSMADRGIAVQHKPLDPEAFKVCIAQVTEHRQ